MSKHLLILANDAVRQRAHRWIDGLPTGTCVEFSEPRRTDEQSKRMWAMLTDIARQKEHAGQKLDPSEWKAVFLHALGRELRFLPALDGQGFVPLGMSSRALTKAEFRDLIELLFAWGAQNGVQWSDPTLSDNSKRAA